MGNSSDADSNGSEADRLANGLSETGALEADGLTAAEGDLQIASFFRPSVRLLRTPDDRLVCYACGEEETWATFVEIDVSPKGRLDLKPLLTVTAEARADLERTFSAVHAFAPDLHNNDGSYDLLLGAPFRQPAVEARIVRDFIPPR